MAALLGQSVLAHAPQASAAQSYLQLAQALNLLRDPPPVPSRRQGVSADRRETPALAYATASS
jgi:hypothetical protein